MGGIEFQRPLTAAVSISNRDELPSSQANLTNHQREGRGARAYDGRLRVAGIWEARLNSGMRQVDSDMRRLSPLVHAARSMAPLSARSHGYAEACVTLQSTH